MQRRRTGEYSATLYPQYEWALDPTGVPVPIGKAVRGASYICPLCQRRMIARLGSQKQHHFAHEEWSDCPPDEVARAAAAKWLTLHLQDCLDARKQIVSTWQCPLCEQTHTADLLNGVAKVEQNYSHDGVLTDVALLDRGGKVRLAILLKQPSSEALQIYLNCLIPVILIDEQTIRDRMRDLPTLLGGATILGGMCTTQQAAAANGVITSVPDLRKVLIAAATRSPYYFYGPLERENDLPHVLTLWDQKLWLPLPHWQRAMGSYERHKLDPKLQIWLHDIAQPDHSTLMMYFVVSGGGLAVAGRRFAPGEPIQVDMRGVPRIANPSANSIARALAEPKPSRLPR